VLTLRGRHCRPRRGDLNYVVTDQLAASTTLGFIRPAVGGRNSKAAYLHGSFGAGKSHFMAVLHLLLQHDARARAQEGLAEVCVKHGWVQGKKFLLVPYHMIGARDMESAILGGYADHVRRVHPDAPWPGIYLADDPSPTPPPLRTPGDDRFFAEISQGPAVEGGKIGADRRSSTPRWRPRPGMTRGRLVGPGEFFPAYQGVSGGKTSRLSPTLELHQPPRQGAGLRCTDPLPRRADPLARSAPPTPASSTARGRSSPSSSRARRPTGRCRS
jgi:hypothetical protein